MLSSHALSTSLHFLHTSIPSPLPMNRRFKSYVRKVHLWLGLASGLIVFIVALTGAGWVFQEEINQLWGEKYPVEAKGGAFITPTQARAHAQQVFPDRTIHGTAYGQPDEPVEVIFYQAEPEFYRSVFLDPYSGKVLGTKDHRNGFFGFLLRGHIYLWIPNRVLGYALTSYGTLIFVVMLLTGLILWWPKKRKGLKQRLTFDWKSSTRWRRKNFDLHTVVGFYAFALALVIGYTGLVMSLGWVKTATYRALGGDKNPKFAIPANSSYPDASTDSDIAIIDQLVPRLRAEVPDYEEIEVHYPATDSSGIYVELRTQREVYYSADFRFFDQRTGQELQSESVYGRYEDAGVADKILRMNYDIHIGAIGGLPGKIIAFVISLLIASLPITGTLLWWGRRKKAKRPKRAELARS